jgi:hypothetical protein
LYDRSDSKMDSESITEDAEEKDKDRFFKSVVGLLTKIDKKLEPKLSDAKLSSQEDILEAGKHNLDAKIKAMIDSAIKESTQNVTPIEDANNADDGLGFPDIDLDLPGRKGSLGKKGGTLGRLGKGALRAARFIPTAGLVVGVGMAAYEGISGWNDAEQILGIKDRDATTGEKAASALAGIAEGITLGLIDKQVAAKFLTDESNIAPGKPVNQEPIYDAMGNFVGMENVDDVPASPDKLEAVNEKVEILDDASDALRRVENQQRALEKASTDDSGTNGPSINTVNNVTNQTLYAPRRYPNNTEVSFNRYISSAFA